MCGQKHPAGTLVCACGLTIHMLPGKRSYLSQALLPVRSVNLRNNTTRRHCWEVDEHCCGAGRDVFGIYIDGVKMVDASGINETKHTNKR